MKAFDADVLTLILQGDAACVHKASLIPSLEQGIPVVVVEEILRGRLIASLRSLSARYRGRLMTPSSPEPY